MLHDRFENRGSTSKGDIVGFTRDTNANETCPLDERERERGRDKILANILVFALNRQSVYFKI